MNFALFKKYTENLSKRCNELYEAGQNSRFIVLLDNLAPGESLEVRQANNKKRQEIAAVWNAITSDDCSNKSEIAQAIGCNQKDLVIEMKSIGDKTEPFIMLRTQDKRAQKILNTHAQSFFTKQQNKKKSNKRKDQNTILDTDGNLWFLFDSKTEIDSFCTYLRRYSADINDECNAQIATAFKETNHSEFGSEKDRGRQCQEQSILFTKRQSSDEGYHSGDEAKNVENNNHPLISLPSLHLNIKSQSNASSSADYSKNEELTNFLQSKLGNIRENLDFFHIDRAYKGDHFSCAKICNADNEQITECVQQLNRDLSDSVNKKVFLFNTDNSCNYYLIFQNFAQSDDLLVSKITLFTNLTFISEKKYEKNMKMFCQYLTGFYCTSNNNKASLSKCSDKITQLALDNTGGAYWAFVQDYLNNPWALYLVNSYKDQNSIAFYTYNASALEIKESEQEFNQYKILQITSVENLAKIESFNAQPKTKRYIFIDIKSIQIFFKNAQDIYQTFTLAKSLVNQIRNDFNLEIKYIYQEKENSIHLQTNYILPEHKANFAIQLCTKEHSYCQIQILKSDQNDYRICLLQPFRQLDLSLLKKFLCTIENSDRIQNTIKSILPKVHQQENTIGLYRINQEVVFSNNRQRQEVKFCCPTLDLKAGFIKIQNTEANKAKIIIADENSIALPLSALEDAQKTECAVKEIKALQYQSEKVLPVVVNPEDIIKNGPENQSYLGQLFGKCRYALQNAKNKVCSAFSSIADKLSFIYCIFAAVVAMCITAFIMSCFKEMNSAIKVASTALVGAFAVGLCYKCKNDAQ